MNSQKQIVENGHHYIYQLMDNIYNNFYKINYNVEITPKEDTKIILDAFFRNCLCLHISFVIISIFVFLFEKIIFIFI